jgi:hypothetical protein
VDWRIGILTPRYPPTRPQPPSTWTASLNKEAAMTNDPTLQAALDRLEALNAERQELELFIRVHRRLSGEPAYRPAAPEEMTGAEMAAAVKATARRSIAGVSTPIAEVLDAARDIIREGGRPVQLHDLYRALLARGVVIGGKNPRNNLCAKLASAPDLKTRAGVGWHFKKEKGSANGLSAEPSHLNGTEAAGLDNQLQGHRAGVGSRSRVWPHTARHLHPSQREEPAWTGDPPAC